MSVVVSVEDVGPCKKQLKVEVPAPAVEAETQRVVREYGQRVRIPGFRKGKVPAELVRRRFQKDIQKEVAERLLPRYWHQAQEDSAVDPLLPPLDDELAGKVGPFENVDGLREAVVARLKAGKVQGRYEQRQKAVLDQLRERHPMELPQGVVRHEVEHLVEDYAQSLAERGV